MLQTLPLSRTVPLLEQVAAFTERRQDVLAGNVANISTPGYKTRDLPVADFQLALRQAVELQRPPAGLSLSDAQFSASPAPPSVAELFPEELFQARERSAGDFTFQDGNNRSIEREVMEMNKNSLLQNFAIELLASQMNLLQAVISERP